MGRRREEERRKAQDVTARGRRAAETPGSQEKTADEEGQGSKQGKPHSDREQGNPIRNMLQLCQPALHLTLVVAICVAGIYKLLQAVGLPGNVQEQSNGVILPVVQIEHGF